MMIRAIFGSHPRVRPLRTRPPPAGFALAVLVEAGLPSASSAWSVVGRTARVLNAMTLGPSVAHLEYLALHPGTLSRSQSLQSAAMLLGIRRLQPVI